MPGRLLRGGARVVWVKRASMRSFLILCAKDPPPPAMSRGTGMGTGRGGGMGVGRVLVCGGGTGRSPATAQQVLG